MNSCKIYGLNCPCGTTSIWHNKYRSNNKGVTANAESENQIPHNKEKNPCKIQGFSQVTINKHDNSSYHTNHNIMFTIQKKGNFR